MIKALKLTLDGYEDWAVESESEVELDSFTTEAINENMLREEEEYDEEEEYCEEDHNRLNGATVSVHPNSISVMYEEGGYIYVKMS